MNRAEYQRQRTLYRRRVMSLRYAGQMDGDGPHYDVLAPGFPYRYLLPQGAEYFFARLRPVAPCWIRPYVWLTTPICRKPENARLGFWRALALSKARAASAKHDRELAAQRVAA